MGNAAENIAGCLRELSNFAKSLGYYNLAEMIDDAVFVTCEIQNTELKYNRIRAEENTED